MLVGIGWGSPQGKSEFSTTRCGIIEVSSKQITCRVAEPLARLFYLEVVMLSNQKAVVQNFCTITYGDHCYTTCGIDLGLSLASENAANFTKTLLRLRLHNLYSLQLCRACYL